MKGEPWRAALVVLRGVAQVMFQPNAATGLLFVAGLAVGSPLVAFGAVFGSMIGAGTALLCKFPRDDIEQGIYGFNSALVGVAPLVLLQPRPMTWLAIAIGCVLAAVVTRLCRRFAPFPTYTAPFVVVTWGLLLAIHGLAGHEIDAPAGPSPVSEGSLAGFFAEVLSGEAEVWLEASPLTGLLFLIGIALSDWRHATTAAIGSMAGTLLASYHRDPESSIALGLYGYNAALAAMAIWLARPSLVPVLLAAAISVPLTEFFPKSLGLPALTAPFVAASWIVLALIALDPYLQRRGTARP
ncbi:Urea transporter [Aquisphaera giovannonii]|uniref:Urea transporter n=1 Tax=Aquisphaera giovannonii TaxID=406548 RepID=A0A5B9WDT8_9BACT|nr:urea transporter [Aquisphaera giovannonii]QEH38742.1 Urea transporter [Aquisphaera giovannonii]